MYFTVRISRETRKGETKILKFPRIFSEKSPTDKIEYKIRRAKAPTCATIRVAKRVNVVKDLEGVREERKGRGR